jgi:hypothetical protein
MKLKVATKWQTKNKNHSQPKAMSHYLSEAATHLTMVAASGASNWTLLTAPAPLGLGLNVKYTTKINDVFATPQSLQQFADEIPATFGVALTTKEITAATTFGGFVDTISAKQILG